jgi:hypothetical protein
MNSKSFVSARKTLSYTQVINALPEAIFPLLCPVREAEWLDGWHFKMIYSVSGFAEPGAVFSTSHTGEEETVWVVTKHDKEKMIVEFTRFTPFNRTCVLEICVEGNDENSSFVKIKYVYTGLSEDGNHFISYYDKKDFDASMKFWEDSMNHFLVTGKMLKK